MMRRYKLLSLLLAPAALALLGCDEDLDVFSEVKTLRVLGVSTESSYAAPGDRPHLEMLLHDGAPGAVQSDGTRRPVQVVWIEGCINVPGDLYYLCYPVLHEVASYVSDEDLRNEQVPDGVPMGFGLEYDATIPTDIIESRQQDPDVVNPYGLAYVFFAACGGELRKLPDADPMEEFPLGCFRPGTNERLGAQDFLHGYFPLYAFESLRNNNPVIQSVAFGPGASGTPCTDSAQCLEGEVCSQAGFCIGTVARCTEDDEEDCPGIYFKPTVEKASVDRAVMAMVSLEEAPLENTWVMYHSNAGSWKAGSQMIHDPDIGFRSEYEGYWRAPKSGNREVRLWAVVRDNRGGVSWVWRDIWVR